MNIPQLRECSVALREEVLRRKAACGDSGTWYEVMCIRTEWMDRHQWKVSTSDAIEHMRTEWGDLGALFILLADINNEVCNGGVAQYFYNGYATRGSAYPRITNVGLLTELICLFDKYLRDLNAKTDALYVLLVDIEKFLSENLDILDQEYREDDDIEETSRLFDEFDKRWWCDEIDADHTLHALVEVVLDA